MSDAVLEPVAGPPTPPEFVPTRPPRLWRVRRFIRSLNPVPLLFGPLFHRDMRISGRRKGVYAARLIVLAIPTAIVALVFAATSNRYSYYGSTSAAARIQSLQDTSSAVAITIAWCQLVMLSLIAPLLTAGSVVEERTARALSVIAASPLSPGRIIGGLFAARMVQLAILAALPLPLILAIRTFGGLETSFILWSSAIAICSAIAMAAVGLWGSTRATRPAAAVSFAILLLLLHWVGPPLIVLCDSALHGWKQPSSFAAFIASPPAALIMLSEPQGAGFFGFRSAEAAAINCAISLTIATAALLLARFQLARLIATDRVELVRQPSRRQRRKALRTQTPDPDAPAAPDATEQHADSRTVAGNPVMWRELRQPLFNSIWKRWLGVAGIAAVVLTIHLATLDVRSYDAVALAMVPTTGALVLLILSAAAVPSGTITTELEARTWATLLTTPLSSLQILLPKVMGSLRRLWPPFLFAILHLLVCIARGIAPPESLPFTLIHFVVYAFFLCCTGVFFSLVCRKSAVASTLNLSLVLGLWLLGPIFVGLVLGLVARGNPGDGFGLFFFSNPVFTHGAGMVGMTEHHARYDMGPLSLSPPQFYILWLLSLGAFLAAATAVLAYARVNFQRLATARI